MEIMFGEFKGTVEPQDGGDDDGDWSMSGDVKYHLGSSYDRTYPDGRKVHLSLLANPSHLEAVNPLVSGKARAKMHYKGDTTGKRFCLCYYMGMQHFQDKVLYLNQCNFQGQKILQLVVLFMSLQIIKSVLQLIHGNLVLRCIHQILAKRLKRLFSMSMQIPQMMLSPRLK